MDVAKRVLFVLWPAAGALAQPRVTVEGGADPTGQNYSWTIQHDHASPLVFVSVPHHRADLFLPPKGWKGSIEHATGWFDRMGYCIARPEDPGAAIARGKSAQFGLRVPVRGIARGKEAMSFRFADGVEASVPAEVPVREPIGEQYTPVIGLGLIFAGLLVFRAWKARRRSAPDIPSGGWGQGGPKAS